ETINRLSIKYRVESFCYLLCNAWELLLKAKIVLDSGDRTAIYDSDWRERRRNGLPPHTIRFGQCVERIFRNDADPIRRNLFCVVDLRNEASHLIIAQLPKDVLSLFQACVLNYHH